MKNKILTILTVTLLLTACNTTPQKEEVVVYRDKPVPVYVVPTPPQIDRPNLLLNEIDKTKVSDGDYVKTIVATNEQLKSYINVLETVIDKYIDLAKSNSIQELENLQKQIDQVTAENGN